MNFAELAGNPLVYRSAFRWGMQKGGRTMEYANEPAWAPVWRLLTDGPRWAVQEGLGPNTLLEVLHDFWSCNRPGGRRTSA